MMRFADVGWDVLLLVGVVVLLVLAVAQGWATWAIALLGLAVAMLALRAGLDLLRRER